MKLKINMKPLVVSFHYAAIFVLTAANVVSSSEPIVGLSTIDTIFEGNCIARDDLSAEICWVDIVDERTKDYLRQYYFCTPNEKGGQCIIQPVFQELIKHKFTV